MPLNQAAKVNHDGVQSLHYLLKTVNFSTANIANGVRINRALPNGASIAFCIVKIKMAFNAGTTNVLTVGTNSASYNDIVAAGDVDESVAEAVLVMTGADLTISADTNVYVKFTETGTAATTGSAEIIIYYATTV